MNTLSISHFSVKHTETVTVSCDVPGFGPLEYRVRGGQLPVLVADAFLFPLILYAAKHGRDLHLAIPISETLAENAAEIAFILAFRLGLRVPQMHFSDIREDLSVRAPGAITGFSSGVDSWFTVKQALIDCDSPSLRLRHLVFNNVGANLSETKDADAGRRAERVAQNLGLGFWRVDSNVDAFLDMDFQRTHTSRNAAVAHLFAAVACRFLYSSCDTYLEAGVNKAPETARADSIILPLMSVPNFCLKSSGSLFTRGEKTRQILSLPDVRDLLDVCVWHDKRRATINCGQCWKCVRTLAFLEAEGVLHEFAGSFDLEGYRKGRDLGIARYRFSRLPTEREVFVALKAAGKVDDRLVSRARDAWLVVRAHLKKRRRKSR